MKPRPDGDRTEPGRTAPPGGEGPGPSEVRLFVYGTLRAGGGAAHLLRGGRLLGAASLRGTMYDVGGRFPAVVLEGEGRVSGELWSCPVDRLPALDRYEGVGEGLFVRVTAEAGGEGCQLYVAGPRLRPTLRRERIVPAGRWGGAAER